MASEPIGTFTIDVVWVAPCVGVLRLECNRCGLVVQTGRGESDARIRAAQKYHVCDPFKKTGYRFDPEAPFTDLEKFRALIEKYADASQA